MTRIDDDQMVTERFEHNRYEEFKDDLKCETERSQRVEKRYLIIVGVLLSLCTASITGWIQSYSYNITALNSNERITSQNTANVENLTLQINRLVVRVDALVEIVAKNTTEINNLKSYNLKD